MKRDKIIQARRHGLELVLLGVALATKSESEKVRKWMAENEMSTDKLTACTSVIEKRDADVIRGFFRTYGVNPTDEKTLIDAIIERVNEIKRTEQLRKSLKEALSDTYYMSDELATRKLLETIGGDA